MRAIDEIRQLPHVIGCFETPPGLNSTLVIVTDLPLPGEPGHLQNLTPEKFAFLKSGIRHRLSPGEYDRIELKHGNRSAAL
jgi:hypothetical protein